MKKSTLSKALAEIGRVGGRNRWKGISKAERSAYAKRIIAIRWARVRERTDGTAA